MVVGWRWWCAEGPHITTFGCACFSPHTPTTNFASGRFRTPFLRREWPMRSESCSQHQKPWACLPEFLSARCVVTSMGGSLSCHFQAGPPCSQMEHIWCPTRLGFSEGVPRGTWDRWTWVHGALGHTWRCVVGGWTRVPSEGRLGLHFPCTCSTEKRCVWPRLGLGYVWTQGRRCGHRTSLYARSRRWEGMGEGWDDFPEICGAV